MNFQRKSFKRQTMQIEQGEHHLLLTYNTQFKSVKHIINKLQPILDHGTHYWVTDPDLYADKHLTWSSFAQGTGNNRTMMLTWEAAPAINPDVYVAPTSTPTALSEAVLQKYEDKIRAAFSHFSTNVICATFFSNEFWILWMINGTNFPPKVS